MIAGTAVGVVDTSVLLNLATPVVDGRSNAPTGADPLKAVLTTYDVHVPASVLGETSEAAADDDLHSRAAELVLKTAHHLATHDVDADIDGTLAYGLDRGESQAIWLANELAADLFVTDAFNTTNLKFWWGGTSNTDAMTTEASSWRMTALASVVTSQPGSLPAATRRGLWERSSGSRSSSVSSRHMGGTSRPRRAGQVEPSSR